MLRLQKRLVGVILGKKGKYHADPLFADLQILKIDDLYRQQLRIHAWKFWNGKLPGSQAQVLSKVREAHSHNTRAAEKGLAIRTLDHKSLAYRVPKEWETIGGDPTETKTLAAFKRASRKGFLKEYGAFKCETRDCYVCTQGTSRNAEP